MPFPVNRLCVFGDSHFACVRIAVDKGLVDTSGVDVEFWGNIGKQFRHLTWRNGQVEPMDDVTAQRFAKTNEKGRIVLNGADFDAIFFMGCRIDVHRLFPEALHRRRTPELRLSAGVERRWFADFIRRQPPYHFARNFAAQADTRVLIAPVPFDTDGFAATVDPAFANARQAGPADRQAVWNVIADVMAEDGVDVLAQPEQTVVNGCCTDPQYAVQKHIERDDRTHKNPAYGALILTEALERLTQKAPGPATTGGAR